MDKGLLEGFLAQGLSLKEISRRTGRHPSTVAYWLKRHGLKPLGHDRFAPKKSDVTRERLQALVDGGAVLREIADELDLSISTVRYWLGKYGLRTHGRPGRSSLRGPDRPRVIESVCRHHGPAEFILENRGAYRCKRCRAAAVSKWRRRVKLKLIEEAGGRCRVCGYDRYQGALHFHHLDPTEKEFIISRKVTRSFDEIRREAAKCVLLCGNCHAEVEAGLVRLEEMPEVGGRVSELEIAAPTDSE